MLGRHWGCRHQRGSLLLRRAGARLAGLALLLLCAAGLLLMLLIRLLAALVDLGILLLILALASLVLVAAQWSLLYTNPSHPHEKDPDGVPFEPCGEEQKYLNPGLLGCQEGNKNAASSWILAAWSP